MVVLIRLIRVGYAYPWTGFGRAEVSEAVEPSKTLWDWLDVLIVPIVLALGGYLFTRSETRRTQDIADQQRDLDREIADERRQNEMLQAYLDQMGKLFLDKVWFEEGESANVRTLVRARTLTVLKMLDAEHNRSFLQFLIKSKLLGVSDPAKSTRGEPQTGA